MIELPGVELAQVGIGAVVFRVTSDAIADELPVIADLLCQRCADLFMTRKTRTLRDRSRLRVTSDTVVRANVFLMNLYQWSRRNDGRLPRACHSVTNGGVAPPLPPEK